jgi:hypothetical protein
MKWVGDLQTLAFLRYVRQTQPGTKPMLVICPQACLQLALGSGALTPSPSPVVTRSDTNDLKRFRTPTW